MLMDASKAKANQLARLLSGQIPSPAGSDNCLTFWYYMYGDQVEVLNVYVEDVGWTGFSNPTWMRTGSQGEHWIQATVELAGIHKIYQVGLNSALVLII